MAAFGVDPSTGQQMPMPPQGVDPNSPPPDPMLQGPVQEDPEELVVEQVERVELAVLDAIMTCTSAIESGVGASDPEFASKFGMTCQALGLTFQALRVSQKTVSGNPPPTPMSPGDQHG